MMRPIHFEIHAENPARAAKFYTDVFGWLFEEYPAMDYWVVYTGGVKRKWGDPVTEVGIDGGMLKRRGDPPVVGAAVNAYVVTMGCEDYDAMHAKILAAGGTVALPKMAIPGMAWQGYYKDTEGNIFGLHQPDPDAQ